ncbi:HDOD domain-containing protein [Marinobacter xestospongiae]|uniref:HDOD domain-containing protein n=1 Tax=Marinobacter xestospongiae TaxID=994319 RepID=UPI002006A55F|nr:HDOD domain-containing protein [Marinobacter xestospongiae]MCK7565270.1 HDOD domain-containing protein [Marinobacter xestospongiae]
MPGLFNWLSKKKVPSEAESSANRHTASPRRQFISTPASWAMEKLEQHLFCWLLEASPRDFQRHQDHVGRILAELGQHIRQGKLDELPRQPMTLPMLLRALSDPDISRSEVTRIILDDPALTEHLLQVANSPYFRPSEQTIETVDQAVFVLGLQGIRSVISAAIMRPMLSARNSSEAQFAQRVWRWGLTCARAAELVARQHGKDTSAYFMVSLLPALAHITLFREVRRIHHRLHGDNTPLPPGAVTGALQQFDWTCTQILANDWNLPPRYFAHLLAAERPVPGQPQTPLYDGILIGTREVLRFANQRNLAEEDLEAAVSVSRGELGSIRQTILGMLKEGG